MHPLVVTGVPSASEGPAMGAAISAPPARGGRQGSARRRRGGFWVAAWRGLFVVTAPESSCFFQRETGQITPERDARCGSACLGSAPATALAAYRRGRG